MSDDPPHALITPTWNEARPMLFALKGLARMHSAGATLQFPGGFSGSVNEGQLILTAPTGEVIFTAPTSWPISKSLGNGPDPRQLTLPEEADPDGSGEPS